MEEMKVIAIVGTKEDFCDRFYQRGSRGRLYREVYIETNTKTKYICVNNEMTAVGQYFDDVILISDTERYRLIYDKIKERGLRIYRSKSDKT